MPGGGCVVADDVIGDDVTADDVILCSGCSTALDMAIFTVGQAGQNVLVPRPGFPLYATLAAGYGTILHHCSRVGYSLRHSSGGMRYYWTWSFSRWPSPARTFLSPGPAFLSTPL